MSNQKGRIIQKGWEFYYTFGILTVANKSSFKLEYNSPIQHENITGIQIRKSETGAKSVNGNDLVNDSVLFSSFLTLKQRNAEVFEKVPLHLIYLATAQGLWYEVNIPLVDMAQSEILCTNPGAIVVGEEYEIVIRYKNKITQKK